MEPTTTTAPLPGNTPVVVLSGTFKKRRGITVGLPDTTGPYAGLYTVELEGASARKPQPLFTRSQLEVQV
jgi:hypothetical protein